MKLSMIVLTASMAYGAVGNLQVRGVTSTQAIIAYTAPDTNACFVEVSESQSYRPLAHDVDPALFAGSNLDSRPDATAGGVQRVFVAGKRRAEKGTNGRWYSRALQAFTSHYFRISCGGSQATGSFLTANIALGNTYNEALPADPAVGARPYFSSTGSYAWPEFGNWNNQDPAARPETVIDPQTGMLLKRMALPQDQPITYGPGGGDHTFFAVADPDGAWTNPTAVLTDDSISATYNGTASNRLFLRSWLSMSPGWTNLWSPEIPAEFMYATLKAFCTGDCAAEKLQGCLSINGVTCWPTNATAKIQEAALTTSQVTFALGTAIPLMDAWTPAGFAPLNRADLSARQGFANVDAGGAVTWQPGGYPNMYFSSNWVSGSKITLSGIECTIGSVAGLKLVTIDPASCPTLTLPVTGVPFAASNVGIMVWKKTATSDTMNIQYANFATGTSQYMDFTASGSAKLCSDTLTQNSATGDLGYHCVIASGANLLYWVDHTTGDSNYLGLFYLPYVAGIDGFGSSWSACDRTLVGTTPTASEHFYCLAGDNEVSQKAVLVSCALTSNNQAGNYAISCTNVTPGSTGKDLNTLVAAFTAADTPAFDSTMYGCGVAGMQGARVILGCGRSSQDTLGWTAVFDPNKVDTSPGCVGGGLPGCVIAAQSSWGTAPARWCVVHTRFISGNTPVVWTAGKFLANQGVLDDGPYTSTITSAPLTSSPEMAAGIGACPVGSLGCSLVTVDGEPCDTSPQAGEASGSRVCPKNNVWAYLQDAKVGDIFSIDSEVTKLVAKSGNRWTLQRGYGAGGAFGHSGSMTLFAFCMAQDDYVHGVSNWSWTWDTAADPHATNSSGTTVKVAWDYDHPTPRPDVTLGGAPSYDSTCGNCYAVREGVGSMGDAPNRHATYAPSFAGATGTASFIERAQDHPSRLQDTAAISERPWLADGRPLQAQIDISDSAVAVSGQLYKVTSTTTDGDNLRRVGYNIGVAKASPTVLVAAGNCSTGSPCPIWNDMSLVEAITAPCNITLTGGTGVVYVYGISSGGLAVRYSSGLSITTDTCTSALGGGFPGTYDIWPATTWPLWSWSATSGVWAASGADSRTGSSGYFGNVTRKIQPTWAYCGMQALIDASSATAGNVLSDTAADSYKYCVARKAGECRSASEPGDIYVNCPNVTSRGVSGYGCMSNMENQDVPVDICIGNNSAYLNSIVQVGFKRSDFAGTLGRTLTKGLTRYKIIDPYWHGKALSDASWVMFRSMHLSGSWADILLGKLPPYPPVDSAVRSTFQAIPVTLTPPAGLTVDNAVVQFGYGENGGSGQFYCTSRQEKCLATAATVPAVPFLFPSDGAGGTEMGVTGLPCANSCIVSIPAIAQRMLYYQVKYRDASNRTVATGHIEIVAVP